MIQNQTILDDYTQKIKDATPGLVTEYNSKSAGITDINQLATISNEEVTKRAEISNEGVGKMADLMLKNKDTQDIYQEWAGKLTDVYTEYAGQITDAYINSAKQKGLFKKISPSHNEPPPVKSMSLS